jgi:N-acetylglucosamine-6-phosphate deacetylase
MTKPSAATELSMTPAVWAVRGRAVFPVGSSGDGDPASRGVAFDGTAVASDLRVVEDAVVVVRGGAIIRVGSYEAVWDVETSAAAGAAGAARAGGELSSGGEVVLEAMRRARTWDGHILPGLVDVHCHGGGGQSFPDARSAGDALVAVQEHRRHATTTLIASLVTDAAETLVRQTGLLAGLCEDGELGGIHLEGPFLSERRAGAQDPAEMQSPNTTLVHAVAEAARGWFAAMTVAPELPGVTGAALDDVRVGSPADRRSAPANHGRDGVIDALVAVGAVPSFGHTDCSAGQMAAAVGAAAEALFHTDPAATRVATATHLFNGMRPIHHRDPGPAMEALAQAKAGKMIVELIADGVHLDPRMVRDVFQLIGPDNVVLVTDAMAAAGMPDGVYELGPAAVTVKDGVARLTNGGSIAGGTAHLIDVVRCAWQDSGVPLEAAVAAASVTPARILGRRDRIGSLQPGRHADLILADSELRPVEVYRNGARV